jgi:hypothetical protein
MQEKKTDPFLLLSGMAVFSKPFTTATVRYLLK